MGGSGGALTAGRKHTAFPPSGKGGGAWLGEVLIEFQLVKKKLI